MIDLLLAHTLFRGSLYPSDLWLAPLPFVVCLALLAYKLKRKPMKQPLVLVACFMLSIIFILELANKSYGYYPTLSSLVSHTHPMKDKDQVVILRTNNNTLKNKAEGSIEKNFTPTANMPAEGKVFDVAIPGDKSSFVARTAHVYIPPAGLADSQLKLPVLILMAGSPGSPEDWLHGGNLEKTTNDFAAKHKGLAPLIFLIDQNGSQTADTECTDSPRGNTETYLTVDVPAYIKTHYNVIEQAQSWAIGGLSNGGTCGVMLALRHPNIYKNFLDFGGEDQIEIGSKTDTVKTLFAGSETAYMQHDLMSLLRGGQFKTTHGWFEYGKDDAKTIQDSAKQLYASSKASGMDVSIEAIQGTHSFYVWAQSFHDSLPWLAQNTGLITCEIKCS